MPSKTEEYLVFAQRPDATACTDFDMMKAQKNVKRFFAEEKETTEKTRTRETNTAEEASCFGGHPRQYFLVYIAVLRSNAPVSRIFSPRSFRVL
mgnify:CR=1 FL=1